MKVLLKKITQHSRLVLHFLYINLRSEQHCLANLNLHVEIREEWMKWQK